MDQELLKLFTKLKLLGKKQQIEVDIVRLNNDSSYAAQVLRALSDAEDADLVSAAILAMHRLGLLEQSDPENAQEDEDKDKYIGSLR